MGVAVAVEGGLLTVVCHDADRKPLRQIAQEVRQMAGRAREGKVRPVDIEGSTFSVSNLGMYGVDIFNAILNPPQSGILAVGRIADRVVPVANQPSIQPMMILSISYDHRVIDGARGARFLETLANFIEEPVRLVE